MTLRITGGVASEISTDKALSRSKGNSFVMEDVSPIVERTQVTPKLLTALFGGTANSVFLQTTTVNYDELEETLQLPDGKSYEAFGPRLGKDKPRNLNYQVGSFGLTANVAPRDYSDRRIPGTDILMDSAYLVSKMNMKTQKAWSQFMELAFRELLVNDTNITRGGPMPQYNFYEQIIGSPRPAAVDMDLGNNAIDHFQNFSEQVDLLEEDLEKTMNSMSMPVAICGTNFFKKRLLIEKAQGGGGSLLLNREIRGGLDLASMGVPESNFGSDQSGFPYQYFDSHDGIRYIRYSASIVGTKLIPDDNAYLVPMGAEMFMKLFYAPAQTEEYTNKVALPSYGWSNRDDRDGVTLWTEKNVLPMTVNPQLIRHLTTTT